MIAEYAAKYYDDPYMKLFLSDVILADSCYSCPFRSGRSGSDYTIGDLWGASDWVFKNTREYGIGAVLVYNERLKLEPDWHKEINKISYNEVISSNPSLIVSSKKNCFARNMSVMLSTRIGVSCAAYALRCLRFARRRIKKFVYWRSR